MGRSLGYLTNVAISQLLRRRLSNYSFVRPVQPTVVQVSIIVLIKHIQFDNRQSTLIHDGKCHMNEILKMQLYNVSTRNLRSIKQQIKKSKFLQNQKKHTSTTIIERGLQFKFSIKPIRIGFLVFSVSFLLFFFSFYIVNKIIDGEENKHRTIQRYQIRTKIPYFIFTFIAIIYKKETSNILNIF